MVCLIYGFGGKASMIKNNIPVHKKIYGFDLALLQFMFLPSNGETKKLRVFPQMYKKEYECFVC